MAQCSAHATWTPKNPTYALYEHEFCSQEKDLFGHEPCSNPYAYKSFLEPTWNRYKPLFTCPKLDLAAQCLRRFDTRYSLKEQWYYIKVYSSHLSSFYEMMIQDHRIFILPFWCWCLDKTGSHRHMILLYPLDCDLLTCPVLTSSPIDSKPMLVDRIMNLSGYHEDSNSETEDCCFEDHFYFHYALPTCAKFILSCLWKGGLQRLLCCMAKDQLNDPNVAFSLLPRVDKTKDGRTLPVQALIGIPERLLLPVPKHFAPSMNPTNFCFHLIGKRKLYFAKDPTLLDLDDEAWAQEQSQRGNLMLDVIHDERLPIENVTISYYFMLDLLEPYTGEIQILEKQMNDLEHQLNKSYLAKTNILAPFIEPFRILERKMEKLKNRITLCE